jgi:tetratricopeptide (TPR) repeat protein
MSLLMQALRRAETAKKQQGGAVPADTGAAAPAAPAGTEMTLEVKELTADEIAAAAEYQEQVKAAQAAAQEAAAAAALDNPAPAAADPVDYFAGATPPARAPYVPPAPQGFDPERGSGSGSAAPAAPLPPAQEAPATPPPRASAAPAAPVQQQAAAQNAARTVFIAKEAVRNRRPLIIAALGLLVLAAGAGIFYFQMLKVAAPQPQAPFPQADTAVLVPTPAAPAPEAVAVVTPAAAATAAAAPAAAIAAPAAAVAAPASAQSPQFAPAAAPLRAAVERRAPQRAPAPVPAPRADPGPAAASSIEVRRSSPARNVNPVLRDAYQAFVAGDALAARSGYQRVLQQEPDNRDALLGMAALAVNRGQDAEAGSFYKRLLELDPSDPQAAAGMAALQRGDPDQAESRLKGVLAASPDTGAALFALGNLYARQARWPEAQLAYFRAVGSEPGNAGYAFNLAVSLDKLNQKKLALDYYRRALQLARQGGATVNLATTEERIRQLEQDAAPR